jgi:hypothetical protein
VSVFPTDRLLGSKAKKVLNKNISSKTNLWLNFGRIFPERGKRWQNFFNVLFSLFFRMKALKTWNFHRFWYLYGFKILSYFDKVVLKMLFYKGAKFSYSAAKFLAILAGKG